VAGGDNFEIVFPGLDPLPALEERWRHPEMDHALGEVFVPRDRGVTTFPFLWEDQMRLIPVIGAHLKRGLRHPRWSVRLVAWALYLSCVWAELIFRLLGSGTWSSWEFFSWTGP
jgi:hypothetical protein